MFKSLCPQCKRKFTDNVSYWDHGCRKTDIVRGSFGLHQRQSLRAKIRQFLSDGQDPIHDCFGFLNYGNQEVSGHTILADTRWKESKITARTQNHQPSKDELKSDQDEFDVRVRQ